MDGEDGPAGGRVRGGDFKDQVEAAGAQQGGVKPVGAVRRRQDHDAPEFLDAVHLSEHLADHPLGHTALGPRAAAGRQRVNLVEEHDARLRLPRFLEDLAHAALALAHVHGHQRRPLDGDEVGLAPVGDGLGQQRFAAAGRPLQQDALGRGGAGVGEQMAVLERPLDGLQQRLLDALQSAHVLPGHVGHLGEDLADGRGFDLAQRGQEVLHGHVQRQQFLVGDVGGGEVNGGHQPAQRNHRRLAAQRLQIGAHKAMGHARQPLQVYCLPCDPRRGKGRSLGQRHAAGVDVQNLAPAARVRDADDDFAVESSGAAQGRVECVGQIRRADHDDLAAFLQPVHQGQQLGDHPALDLLVAGHLLALGGDGVNFVNEDDGRSVAARVVEHGPQVGLGFAVELGHNLRTGDVGEVGAGFAGDGPRDQRLAAAGRAVEQHPPGRVNSQALEHLRVFQRQFDHLADALDFTVPPADVLVRPRRGAFRLRAVALEQDARARRHQRHPRRRHVGHPEVLRPGAEQVNPHPVAGHQRLPLQQAPKIPRVGPGRAGARGTQGHEGQAARRLVSHGPHRGLLVQADAGILADDAVNLQGGLAPIGPVGRHGLDRRAPGADNLDDVADLRAQRLQVLRVKASNASPPVSGLGLGHAQRQRSDV